MATATAEPEIDISPVAPWRSIPVEELGLQREIQAMIYKRDVDTIGRLYDRIEKGETFNLEAGVILNIRNMIVAVASKGEPEDANPKAWRELPVADLELDPESDTAKALAGAKFLTLGQIANEFERCKLRPILGLGMLDSKGLADLINLAAEEDDSFEEIIFTDEEEGDEADGEPKTWRDIVYDPTTPEGLTAYDEQTRKMLDEDVEEVGDLEAEFERAHKLASAAKKSLESTRDDLLLTIRERKDGRNKKPQPTVLSKPADVKQLELATPSALDDLYLQFPITFERWERFGLTAKDVEKLNGGETKNHGTYPIAVFGDMQRFITPTPSNPSYARSLKDFKGFGDGGADRWAEAETKFWAWWKNGGQNEFAREKGLLTEVTNQPDDTDADDSRPLSDAAERLPEIPEAGKKPKRGKAK